MKEEIFNGIKYQLDEEMLTADVIENVGRERKVDIPEVVVFNEVFYRVTRIKVEGFSGCPSLTSITIPKSVTSIESGAFNGCDHLTSIVVAEGNTVYDSRDNCNAIIEKATNTLICGCRNTTIPNSVTSIGVRAFNECYKLTDITIPDSVTEIETRAFANCQKLIDITIPDSVTSIGERAFLWCFSLSTVTIPNSVTAVGKRAFSGCGLISITIPDSVTSIGEETFLDCESLEEIVIGNSVKSIGAEAFCRCEMLTDIIFRGTIAQWGRIELGDGWNDEVPARVVRCTDGNVKIQGVPHTKQSCHSEA